MYVSQITQQIKVIHKEKELLGVNHLCQVHNPDRTGSFSGGVNHCDSIDFSKAALSGDMTLFVFLLKVQQ